KLSGVNEEAYANTFLHSTLNIAIAGDFTITSLEVLGYPENDPQYIYCVETSEVQHPYLHVRKPLSGDNIEFLNESVKLVLDRLRDQIVAHGRIMVSADDATTHAFERFLPPIVGRPFNRIVDSECAMFCMTCEQRQKLAEMDIPVPDGVTLEKVDADRDGETIHAMWKNGISADVTIARLRYFPSICARDQNGNLLGWAMSGRFGQISNEFVLPEHRNKGLGKAIETRLAQEMTRMGHGVLKYVEYSNTNVYESALRNPLWTLWRMEDEKTPNNVYFRKFEIL
ncbi:hypothetical protein PFISCL1PPCAC_24579, partial [Pristionchus fissidentatus]